MEHLFSSIVTDISSIVAEISEIEEGLRGSVSRPTSASAEGQALSRAGRQNSSSVCDHLHHLQRRLITLQDARLDAVELPSEDGEALARQAARAERKALSTQLAALLERVGRCQTAVMSHAPLDYVEAMFLEQQRAASAASAAATSIEGQPLKRQKGADSIDANRGAVVDEASAGGPIVRQRSKVRLTPDDGGEDLAGELLLVTCPGTFPYTPYCAHRKIR